MSRVAVIDIGTNSVKALVGETQADGTLVPLWETSEQTRLGSGSYGRRWLQTDAVRRTASCVASLAEKARAHGAQHLSVIATSAAREAGNPHLLLEAVRRTAGLDVQVISGEQEAEWMYHGVRSDVGLPAGPLLIVDVGGGSTELVLGEGRSIRFRQSYALGTVRLLEGLRIGDSPQLEEWRRCHETIQAVLVGEVLPALEPYRGSASAFPRVLVGASGTATILARLERGVDSYRRERLEGVVLSLERLRDFRERLWGMSLEQRRRMPGMPAERADVMLTGVAIYEGILTVLCGGALRVSLRGLRFGAAVDLPHGS